MKSIFISYIILSFLLIFPLASQLQAAVKQGKTEIDQSLRIDPNKVPKMNQEGEGEGEGDENESDGSKKDQAEKERKKKAKVAKSEDSSFGMLKDLFQNTFEYFYAPDSTKSEDIGKQK